MNTFIALPDAFPISEWMLAYCCMAIILATYLIWMRKTFLSRYLVFFFVSFISIYVVFIGLKTDHRQASNQARELLANCALNTNDSALQEKWLYLSQTHSSKRYQVYRQVAKCNWHTNRRI